MLMKYQLRPVIGYLTISTSVSSYGVAAPLSPAAHASRESGLSSDQELVPIPCGFQVHRLQQIAHLRPANVLD